MTEMQITPWEVDETTQSDNFVPAYIEEMATEVMTHYDMEVSGMEVITTKADKGG